MQGLLHATCRLGLHVLAGRNTEGVKWNRMGLGIYPRRVNSMHSFIGRLITPLSTRMSMLFFALQLVWVFILYGGTRYLARSCIEMTGYNIRRIDYKRRLRFQSRVANLRFTILNNLQQVQLLFDLYPGTCAQNASEPPIPSRVLSYYR